MRGLLTFDYSSLAEISHRSLDWTQMCSIEPSGNLPDPAWSSSLRRKADSASLRDDRRHKRRKRLSLCMYSRRRCQYCNAIVSLAHVWRASLGRIIVRHLLMRFKLVRLLVSKLNYRANVFRTAGRSQFHQNNFWPPHEGADGCLSAGRPLPGTHRPIFRKGRTLG